MGKCTNKILSFALGLSLLAAAAVPFTVSAENESAVLSAAVIPEGITTYDFTKLTNKTLAEGTAGFEGFSGSVTSLSSDSKSYVQLTKTSTDSLIFTVSGTWSATFSSTHSNNAKGTVITASDGTNYGTKASEALELTNMAPGTYTIKPAAVETSLINGTGSTVTVGSNHSYISYITFNVESSNPPEEVANLTAAAGDGYVSLDWDASEGASSYSVYVNDVLKEDKIENTSYTVTGLTNDTEYTFKVCAVNGLGTTAGATVTATPKEPVDPPAVPAVSTVAKNESIVLSWDVALYAKTYNVYRDNTMIAENITATTYTDTGLTNDTEYSYTVEAVNKNGSTMSEAVTAVPKAPIPSSIRIEKQMGWLESVYVTWTNPTEVEKYIVYYKGVSDTEYTQIDDELIRYYGAYYRADILGLKAGAYTIKVSAVVNGAETDAVESDVITVLAHDRSGFAHDLSSPNYNPDGVGGYKNDGTLKDNAQVIYIDSSNVNTVKHTVMVGGKETEGIGLVNILSLREKNNAETTPLIIRLIGKVTDVDALNSAGYIQVKSTSNVTIEGVGDDSGAYGWSFLVRDTNNIEIRNLAVMEFYDDGISLDTDNFNDWIHNIDLFYGANRGGDQKKGDGSIDVKSGSDYCTLSFNHFWDCGKTSLCGMKVDSYMGYHITYHHNWFDHSDSRHPRVRGDQVHVYNNYYDGISKYGAGATTGSSIFMENNFFRNTLHPVLISKQGTDIAGDATGTFSGEDGGMIKMYGNILSGTNTKPVINAKDEPVEFDAYIADTRDEIVPDTYTAKQGGSVYSNFDTASTMYKYTADDAKDVPAKVETYAGRIEGGDFHYDFNDEVDDYLYDRDEILGAMLEQYQSSIVSTYTAEGTYPSTAGELSTPKPTIDPTPTENPSQAPDTSKEEVISWKASKDVAAGETLTIPGLTPIIDMTYGATTKFDGFTGKCVGTVAASENGKAGNSLKFIPEKDGVFTVYYKVNAGKTFTIMDEAGTIVASNENTDTASVYTSTTCAAKAGTTYYAFINGSKAEFFGAKFVTSAEEVPVEYDYEITSAVNSGNDLSVIISGTADGTAYKMIAAKYNIDNVLTGIKLVEISGSGTYTAEGMAKTDGSNVKVFIIDMENNYKPAAKAYMVQ